MKRLREDLLLLLARLFPSQLRINGSFNVPAKPNAER